MVPASENASAARAGGSGELVAGGAFPAEGVVATTENEGRFFGSVVVASGDGCGGASAAGGGAGAGAGDAAGAAFGGGPNLASR